GAELAETGARAVAEGAVSVEGGGELVGQVVERRVGRARVEEGRHARAARGQEATEDARPGESLADLADFLRSEDAGSADSPDGRGDVRELRHRQRLACGEEIGGLARFAGEPPGLV